MKALITGINGFAGQHLAGELKENGYQVFGIDLRGNDRDIFAADLRDEKSVKNILDTIRPDFLFHLAGQANVKMSWENPLDTMHMNIDSAITLLSAVSKVYKGMRIVVIGSADQYGIVKPEDCPIKETMNGRPATPYAVSKQAQENLVQCIARAKEMDVVYTRSFNHTGPGQKIGFVVADLASRIVDVKRHGGELRVGNLQAKRDFSDVRDSVRAYRLLMEKGKTGEIYNVGSGIARSVESILYQLIKLSGVEPEIVVAPENFRPIDMPISVADCSKIFRDTGYQPKIPFEQTLKDILECYLEQ